MARRARVNVPGGVVHIVSRFARETPWLDRPGGREAYLAAVQHALKTCDVEVLAYCLMSNHVHLVVVQGGRPLERFTKSVHTTFANWCRKQVRPLKAVGAIFAERPRHLVVDRDAYLLELVRYVHNNPVRAGVVRFARSSRWSSHQAYVGRTAPPPWLRTGYVLGRYGKDERTAITAFDEFVDEGRKQARRPELSGSTEAWRTLRAKRGLGDGHRLSDGVLGPTSFVERVRADTDRVEVALSGRGAHKRSAAPGRPTLSQVIAAAVQMVGVDSLELDERPRARLSADVKRLATWVWIHEYEGKQIDVARAFGIATGAVSRHYGHAVRNAGDYDTRGSALVARLRRFTGKRTAKAQAPTEDAHRVRYHVDVDER